MKKYFFLLIMLAGLMVYATAPPPDVPQSTDETVFVETDQVVTDLAVTVPEVIDIGETEVMMYQASFLGDFFNDNVDIIAIALLIFTTLFGGLWLMLRNKLRQIGELFLKAYEYTDDKKLDEDERADLKRRFLEIITRSPT